MLSRARYEDEENMMDADEEVPLDFFDSSCFRSKLESMVN